MEFILDSKSYHIRQPELIPTPRLLVFWDRVHANIKRMRELLQTANPALDLSALCPHVKTHKSAMMTRLCLEQGISFFKSSLNEVDMLVECGAPKIFVAYPLLEHDARRMAELIKQHSSIQFYVQVSCRKHVDILAKVSRETKVNWLYYIDVNIGMNRSGLPVEDAFDFFLTIKDEPFFEFAGLHAYDGHVHQKSISARRRTSTQSMERLQKSVNHFSSHGVKVPHIMVAGTPSFIPDVEFWRDKEIDTEIIYSPGTWIYFDSATHEMMPNTFEYAAVLLTQVIDKPTPDTATLNLGHKRWAIDMGPIDTFSVAAMRAQSWSEEHTVVTVPKTHTLNIGDYVLVVPRHVCSTVNLWEYFAVLDEHGVIIDRSSPVTGRNR